MALRRPRVTDPGVCERARVSECSFRFSEPPAPLPPRPVCPPNGRELTLPLCFPRATGPERARARPGSQSRGGPEPEWSVLLLLWETLGGPGPQSPRGRGECQLGRDHRARRACGARHARGKRPQTSPWVLGAQQQCLPGVCCPQQSWGYNMTRAMSGATWLPAPAPQARGGRAALPLPAVQMGCGGPGP